MYKLKSIGLNPPVIFVFSSAPFMISHYFITDLSNFGHENN